MQTVRLEKGEWSFDEAARLGPPGGFGEVFSGTGPDGPVAVKRLKISAGAASHREMAIGAALSERAHEHVVPVLDYGKDADGDRYYLVMPICEYSLQDRLSKGSVNTDEAVAIGLEIISGLTEVSDIVHRDLKPGNVLWHEHKWKIADFGIAKFVEDATSLQSLRSSLTPPYAAPEQWRSERPTAATDVYALGCIFHAMIAGQPPFVGDTDDVREAHLQRPAPPLPSHDNRLNGLVGTMLRKAPESRPTLERCKTVLSSLGVINSSSGRAALAAAGHVVSQAEAAAEAEAKARETAELQRRELIKEAENDLDAIVGRLFDVIQETAESARRDKNAISLGPANLLYEVPHSQVVYIGSASRDAELQGINTGWDIETNAYFTLTVDRSAQNYRSPGYRFGVSFVFAKIPGNSEFRWREISFWEVMSNRSNSDQPFYLNPFQRDFAIAVSNVMGRHSIAHGPLTIDGEDEGDFQERWLRLFAKAANGQLYPPNQLPLSPNFFS